MSEITPIFDPNDVFADQSSMYCGEHVQIIEGNGYMGCYGGPSRREYNDGGSIIRYDLENSNELTKIGVNNASRGIRFGKYFVVKDDRDGGGGIHLVSSFGLLNQIYVQLDDIAHFIAIDEVGWTGSDTQVDCSLNGSVLIASSTNVNSDRGLAKYYRLIDQEYEFQSDLIPSSYSDGDRFGSELSITDDGKILAIASPGLSLFPINNAGGGIFIFHYDKNESNFIESQLLLPSIAYSDWDYFGSGISISSNGSKLIGCSNTDDVVSSDEGSCHVFGYDEVNQSYMFLQRLVGSDASAGNRFGIDSSMSSNGGIILVSTWIIRKVYVFRYYAGSNDYGEVQIIYESSEDGFGWSVDITSNGNEMIVGVPTVDLNGFIYVGKSVIYERDDISGFYTKKLDDELSPSIYSNTLLPAKLQLSMNDGGGFIFQPWSDDVPYPSRYYFFESDFVWKSTDIMIPLNITEFDRYGNSVVLSNSNQYVSISATTGMNPSSGSRKGIVYLYEFNDDDNQFEENYLIYADSIDITGVSSSGFGNSLKFSMDETKLVVGCSRCSLNDTYDGVVFIFDITSTLFALNQFIFSPTPSIYGYFGSSLMVASNLLGIGAMGEQTLLSSNNIGQYHLYSIDENLSNITWIQTIYPNDTDSIQFGSTSELSMNGEILIIGSPQTGITGIFGKKGAIYVYQKNVMNQYDYYDFIFPFDVIDLDFLGEYMTISEDGNLVLIGSPRHDMNGEPNTGQVYSYLSLGLNRLNGSDHYELDEIIYSPEGIISGSYFGMGVKIHPFLNITLISQGLSNQQDRDRPTTYIYENDRLINITISSSSSISGDDDSDNDNLVTIIGSILGSTLGTLVLIFLYCLCCLCIIICIILIIFILLAIVLFILLVGLGGLLGGTGTMIGMMRSKKGGDDSMMIEMDILDQSTSSMPEYKKLDTRMIKIEKQIGEGAYGVVFKGQWKGVPVAIKQVQGHLLDEKARNEFMNEIRVMGKLGNHSNVITFIGAVTEGEQMMLVTKYYSKGSLEDYILKDKGFLSDEILLSIIKDCASGLNHLHLENIVHKDIATRNVLLESDYTGVISDFGYSRFFEGEGGETRSEIGPIPWMSPESVTKRIYSIHSDSWMFGAMLCEIYTKQIPYGGRSMIDIIPIIQGGGHPEIPYQAPSHIQSIMKGVFKQEPTERLSMSEIYEMLSKSLEVEQVEEE